MSFRAELYDGGTRPIVPVGDEQPGMDRRRYIDVDYEYDLAVGEIDRYLNGDGRTNQHMKIGFNGQDMRPWPRPLPYHQWIDKTDRYEGDKGGISMELFHRDRVTNTASPVPETNSRLHNTLPDRVQLVEPWRDLRMVRNLSWRETRAKWPNNPGLIRRDTDNEGPNAAVQEPVVWSVENATGSTYRLVVPDNPIIAPFDLSEPDRYTYRDRAGNILDPIAADLHQDAQYNLYFRPRQWRYFATVLCHFLWVSWFETVPNDEIFIKLSWDRPPTFPQRHQLLDTRGNQDVQDFFGNFHAFDPGIEYQWTHSRAQSRLTEEIYQNQWAALCIVYVFIGNEDPVLEIEVWPPQQGELVLTIGRYDPMTDKESLVYVFQNTNLDQVYPRTSQGTWLVNWRLPARGLF